MKTRQTLARGILAASAAVLCALTTAHADTFGSGPNAFSIDFVDIGSAGNADDAGAGGGLYSSPYGGVSYSYRMGTYEISEDAITKATAGGLSGVMAGAHTGNEPAANMTWFEAAAFVNWLNDQRTPGLKAYQLDIGLTTLTPWASGDAWQLGGENLYRHKDAYYFLPSEDEWYKAAYHKNDGVTANYWDYATGSNTIPTQELTGGTLAGSAVFSGPGGGAFDPAEVNLAGGLSPYGTMGQNGNVWEWHESARDGINNSSSEDRVYRSGVWDNTEFDLRSSFRGFADPLVSDAGFGFRVASVPEPSSTVLMLSAGVLALARRPRRAAL